MSKHRTKPARSLGDRMVTTMLELVLTAGALVLLFVVYQAYVTDLFAGQRQDEVAEELREDWQDSERVPPTFGEAFAFIHMPAIGESLAVLEGTDDDTLDAGPGHYSFTALPGEVGNFSVAGHRLGQGAPFRQLDELEPGDPIVVETVDTWFTYTVTESRIIEPSDTGVLHPVPGGAIDDAPVDAYLTLTTCHPEFSVKERLIVHALLSSTVPKSDAPDGPAVLLASA